MKVNKCKGMKDLSPDEMEIFRRVEGIYYDCCSGWGYREVRTPTIEYLHLFTSAGTLTPSRLGRVYSFLDWDGWSGERVVLKPDGTIPVARLYTESYGDKGLARLFYSTSIFIFEETGEKTRERWQCGAEIIGAGSTTADTELILLSLEVLKELGLTDVELRLSHAGLLKTLLDKPGLSREERNKLFSEILDGDVDVLSRIKRDYPEIENTLLPLLNLKGQSSGFIRNQRALLIRDLPEVGPHLDDLLSTVTILDELECPYRIDIASGAGFEYYTGMIFQLYVDGEKIGGGGRYDALIPSMGGGDVPASGLALYLDQLVKIVNAGNLKMPEKNRVLVRASTETPGAVKEVFKTAAKLREAGYIAEVNLDAGATDDAKWTIDVTDEPGLVTVTEKQTGNRSEAMNIDEAVSLIGEG